MSLDIYNKNDSPPQSVFDSLNSLIMSNDRKVFFKLTTKISLFLKVHDIPGDIVECGVFKGCGLILWLKLIDMYFPHSIKKVIGFDFFDPSFVSELSDYDRKYMSEVLSRTNAHELSEETILKRILDSGFDRTKFELVKGDISLTSKEYVKSRKGMRISLLYMDLDLDKPTYETLVNLWDHMAPGGIVVFDEYGYHIWTESNAVDRFAKEKGLTIYPINVQAPTAYIVKPRE